MSGGSKQRSVADGDMQAVPSPLCDRLAPESYARTGAAWVCRGSVVTDRSLLEFKSDS